MLGNIWAALQWGLCHWLMTHWHRICDWINCTSPHIQNCNPRKLAGIPGRLCWPPGLSCEILSLEKNTLSRFPESSLVCSRARGKQHGHFHRREIYKILNWRKGILKEQPLLHWQPLFIMGNLGSKKEANSVSELLVKVKFNENSTDSRMKLNSSTKLTRSRYSL